MTQEFGTVSVVDGENILNILPMPNDTLRPTHSGATAILMANKPIREVLNVKPIIYSEMPAYDDVTQTTKRNVTQDEIYIYVDYEVITL